MNRLQSQLLHFPSSTSIFSLQPELGPELGPGKGAVAVVLGFCLPGGRQTQREQRTHHRSAPSHSQVSSCQCQGCCPLHEKLAGVGSLACTALQIFLIVPPCNYLASQKLHDCLTVPLNAVVNLISLAELLYDLEIISAKEFYCPAWDIGEQLCRVQCFCFVLF